MPFRFVHVITVAVLASALADCRAPADAARPRSVAVAVHPRNAYGEPGAETFNRSSPGWTSANPF